MQHQSASQQWNIKQRKTINLSYFPITPFTFPFAVTGEAYTTAFNISDDQRMCKSEWTHTQGIIIISKNRSAHSSEINVKREVTLKYVYNNAKSIYVPFYSFSENRSSSFLI